ncbi:hypothetical protein I3760_01G281900 [Carya illinoinensis]|nr:hypothetical protein I3760_01G281900 [Carya illinoinensis]
MGKRNGDLYFYKGEKATFLSFFLLYAYYLYIQFLYSASYIFSELCEFAFLFQPRFVVFPIPCIPSSEAPFSHVMNLFKLSCHLLLFLTRRWPCKALVMIYFTSSKHLLHGI